MDDIELQKAAVAQRERLAGLLAALPEPRWDEPTLCTGWRVRELIAHVTMPFRYSTPQFLRHLARDGGNFNRMADRRARTDAETLTAAQLAAAVRDNVAFVWKPPGGGLLGALTHDTIHSLDFTVPLGLDWQVPEPTLRAVLGNLTPATFDVDLAGTRLEATDLEWGLGTGEPLRGTAQDLLLLLSGRRLPADRLSGPGRRPFGGRS